MEKTSSVDDGAAPGPMMCFTSDDPLLRRLFKARMVAYYMLMVAVMLPFVPLLLLPSVYYEPTCSVDLPAFEGLRNATHGGKLLSPAFNLTVHVDNRQAFRPWCHNHGEVMVSYSGVVLAWGRVGGLCVQRRSVADLPVVTWGDGVRLSDELRSRLTSELRTGTVKVLVEMKLHYYPNYGWIQIVSRSGTLSVVQEFVLH